MMYALAETYALLGTPFVPCYSPNRPPWALAESDFIRLCEHCGRCVDACPEHILVNGRGGFPEIDFSGGGCTFCGKCSEACDIGGLGSPEKPPWHMLAFIANSFLTNRDVACRRCVDACPSQAVSIRPQVGHCPVPIVETMQCNGCGACVSTCPASAVSIHSIV